MSRWLGLTLLALTGCLLPELERDPEAHIRQALPNWTAACDSCLQERCSEEIQRCAADSSCPAFTTCRWGAEGGPNPASALDCEQQYGVSDEQPGSAVRALSNCWQGSCAAACELGTRWECTSGYAQPAPEADVVTVRQVLQQLQSEQPVSGASVRFCDSLVPSSGCDTNFDGEGITDSGGIAAVDVRIATDDRPGWSGYRRVTLPDGAVMSLQSNLVVPRSRFALQHVPSVLEMAALQLVFRNQIELGNVVFQVFDCAHSNADSVYLELSADTPDVLLTTERTQLGYLRDQGFGARLDTDGTRTEHGGGGAILNLQPNEWAWVTARLGETGPRIARTRIRTVPGELLLLQLHPEPSSD